jgi:hypothetical protein
MKPRTSFNGLYLPAFIGLIFMFTADNISALEPKTEMRLPSHSISGRVAGDRNLGGRKVIVRCAKSGTASVRTQELTLNSSGYADYRFALGEMVMLAHGTYILTVQQGPANRAHYASEANYCFRGTTPLNRAVTIDAAHRNVSGQDFTINIVIAWDRDLCW